MGGLDRELTELGVICRLGDIKRDVVPERRSYFEDGYQIGMVLLDLLLRILTTLE